MGSRKLDIRIFDDGADLGREAAALTAACARDAIAARGAFHLILAGGNTPRFCYEALRHMPLDWARIHIWFGDERCMFPGDPERNDTMADEALLAHVSIPAKQIHRMPAELGPEEGAARYAIELAAAPVADMLHLGMGEDGHTASLFPGNPALDDPRPAVPVFDSPKPPPERISIGLATLNAARRKLILAAGASKYEAIHRIQNGERLPAALITDALWLVDRAAAG